MYIGGDYVAKRLTDKKKKTIIADYLDLGTYSQTAKKNGVSVNTVKNIVKADPEFAKKCNDKKEANANDIIEHLEKRKGKAFLLIDRYLDEMLNEDKIKSATINQLSTTFGTVIDKFVKTGGSEGNGVLEELIKGLKDEV